MQSSDTNTTDRMVEIMHLLSIFGSLIYNLLVSRLDIIVAVGFVCCLMNNIGIEHCGALQVIVPHLQDVYVDSSTSGVLIVILLELI